MSIVCTLESKVNILKGSATKNLLILKQNNSNNNNNNNNNTTTTDNTHKLNSKNLNNFKYNFCGAANTTNTSDIFKKFNNTANTNAITIANNNNSNNSNSFSNNNQNNCNSNNNNTNTNNSSSNNNSGSEINNKLGTINDFHINEKNTFLERQYSQEEEEHIRSINRLDYKSKFSVCDFIARNPTNYCLPTAGFDGENTRRTTVAMPEVLNITAPNNGTINNIHNNKSHKFPSVNSFKNSSLSFSKSTTSTNHQSMNSIRMSTSPSLSINGSSNEATNVHGLSVYGPMSPQSSDSGHSMSDSMISHINANGKYGGNYNGSSNYENHKSNSQHHKELFTQRKQREFTPDNKKDDSYWDRRRRNNEAAKRSREKRRYNDMVLEQRVVELTKENHVLKAQLDAIKDKFNISGENLVSVEQILASLPTSEQVLSVTKRAKLTPNGFNNNMAVAPPAIVYTPAAPVPLSAAAAAAAAVAVASHPPLALTQKNNNILNHQNSSDNTLITGDTTVAGKTMPQSMSQVIKNVSHSHMPIPTLSSISPVTAHLQLASQTAPTLVPNTASTAQLVPPLNQHYSVQQQQQLLHPQPSVDNTPSNLNGIGACVNACPDMSTASNTNNAGMKVQNGVSNMFAVSTTTNQIENSRPQIPTNVPPQANLQSLHVLQALNRNVNSDDLDHLRKVVAVVGANVADLSNVNGLYGVAQAPATLYAPPGQSTNGYAFGKDGPSIGVGNYLHTAEATVSSSGVDTVSSSSTGPTSVLNLSRRACTPSYENILSSTTSSASSRLSSSLSSSASSSGAVSGDDEHEHDAVDEIGRNSVVNISNISPNNSNDSNNCLPLKLRHKSHLGDKDAAATALLALQHIKQEPICNRETSPNTWADGGDNSSDERDSGISIGSAEWTAQLQQKILAPKNIDNCAPSSVVSVSHAERERILKSQLARLESEVANIKNMMIRAGDQ
ncbi:uncharacterized protein DDB_G0292186 [Teleopsis dalmanni]|uniref:uncharacterized protein DDB_G0292186 n=1 Tax=Teleopsis dalmanni TaxID=139649 RepID=UPI0018CCF333|nr:uncharacterized protein DDB_G0292186 [Teleopsis dalmanni]